MVYSEAWIHGCVEGQNMGQMYNLRLAKKKWMILKQRMMMIESCVNCVYRFRICEILHRIDQIGLFN